MVDLESHRIVDMLESREYAEVKAWLERYPCIDLVSRDGSLTYHNAVTDAFPMAVQVSDRFHLLKNLTDYAKGYLKKELQANVKVLIEEEIPPNAVPAAKADENRRLTLQRKYELILELTALGYGKTAICKQLNMDVRAYDRLVKATPEELDAMFVSKTQLNHEETLRQKQERINEVRELRKQGFGFRAIAETVGVDRRTVKKYLDESFNPVHASYGQKKPGILTPFEAEINNMLEMGHMGAAIETKIRENGYSGSASNIRKYISDWKHQRQAILNDTGQASNTIVVSRKELLRLLYQPLEKVTTLTEPLMELVRSQYPAFGTTLDIVWEFKAVLDSKDEGALNSWIGKAKSLGIEELSSFIEGLTRDPDAVRMAVVSPYSNGLAEGSINKLKLIKRVMYGRCSFDTLKNKTLWLEYFRHLN